MIQEIELRRADVIECLAGGMGPTEALRVSMDASHINYTSRYKGSVVAYWGIRHDNVLLNHVSMWCLTTPVADTCRVFFARESQRMTERLLYQYDRISCLVYSGHSRARRWLTWLGFEEVEEVYLNGELFFLDMKGRV